MKLFFLSRANLQKWHTYSRLLQSKTQESCGSFIPTLNWQRGIHFLKAHDGVEINRKPFHSNSNPQTLLDIAVEDIKTLPLEKLLNLLENALVARRTVPHGMYHEIFNHLINIKGDILNILKCLCAVILSYTTENVEFDASKCCKFLEQFRETTVPQHQLELLNINYALQFGGYSSLYSKELERYFDYLKLQGPIIRLQCPHELEPPEISQVQKTLDKLKVGHFSGITGNVRAVDVREFYGISDGEVNIYQLGNGMDWKAVSLNPTLLNPIEAEKEQYLSKFLSEFYFETQFIKRR
ncbi:hypothetical protein BdWA1_000405 [Babesia duncani]|uniref:Uncharacterized protein n=1 Tax=Babesia duncani TaxID=323732 RepID=A0AAD9PM40_9APIC|nr:hypothetical protein BdWA1_000405 [Babesia duncani]